MSSQRKSGALLQTRENRANAQPLVSVVTPVYNGGPYLSECIESVLTQEYSNWEYVILDNNSSDDTGDIIEGYARRDRRIRIFRNDSVLPIMANWNTALAKISPNSQYCKVVHADDRLFPRCVRSMVEVAERHPSVGIVGAYSLHGNQVTCDGLPLEVSFMDGRELVRMVLLGKVWPFVSPSSLLIRSDLIRSAGHYYPGSELHADVSACYEVLRTADFGFAHEVLTFIRRHGDSMTAKEAAPLQRIQWSNLALFVEYGPLFLEQGEYRMRLTALWNKYLTFLARSLLSGRPQEFFHFHREGLRKLGLPLSRMRLVRAVFRECLEHPVASLWRLKTRYGSSAQRI